MSEKERIEVVDHGYNFAIVYNAFIRDTRLSAYDRAVYMALKFFAGSKNVCWPSGENIAKYSGCGRSTAFNSLDHLEKFGYITRAKRAGDGDFQKTTVYHLTEPENWPSENDVSPSDGLSVSATRTAGVHETDGGCPPDGQELNTRTIHNELDPPLPPLGEQPDDSPLPEENDPSEADAETAAEPGETDRAEPAHTVRDPAEEEKLFERATAAFPGLRHDPVSGGRLREVLREWSEKLGASACAEAVEAALLFAASLDRSGKKRIINDSAAFYDDWLKRAADDANFEKWWSYWPGVTDGYEKARAEWRNRLGPLKGEARLTALRCLFAELDRLRERAAAGAEIEYLPRARTLIRDAKLDALPEASDD